MKRINVPICRTIPLLNYLERELISGRNNGATRLTLSKELFFRNFSSFSVMRDEDDVYVVVLSSEESDHPEVKTPCDVFFELTHCAGHVDHCNDDCVRFVTHHFFPRLETQVFLLDVPESRITLARVAANVLENHATFVEIRNDSSATNLIELRLARLNRFLCLFLQVGQLQIFKYESSNLVDIDLSFVIINAAVLTRLTRSTAGTRSTLTTNHIADTRLAITLSDVLSLLIIKSKLVFVEGLDRNFDGPFAVREDDGLV